MCTLYVFIGRLHARGLSVRVGMVLVDIFFLLPLCSALASRCRAFTTGHLPGRAETMCLSVCERDSSARGDDTRVLRVVCGNISGREPSLPAVGIARSLSSTIWNAVVDFEGLINRSSFDNLAVKRGGEQRRQENSGISKAPWIALTIGLYAGLYMPLREWMWACEPRPPPPPPPPPPFSTELSFSTMWGSRHFFGMVVEKENMGLSPDTHTWVCTSLVTQDHSFCPYL